MCSYLPVSEKLEHKFKNAPFLNIGKELFRLINLYKRKG